MFGIDLTMDFINVEIDLALGKIDEVEALRRMQAVNDRAWRRLQLLGLIEIGVAALVVVGLATLAIRLGTFT